MTVALIGGIELRLEGADVVIVDSRGCVIVLTVDEARRLQSVGLPAILPSVNTATVRD